MIPKKISHYKILEKIGEGGMGEVYKAEDTKLKRIVALKFLPRKATMSEEDSSRFIHEARAAATLDHPNICTVHEINEVEEQTFIAMGYIEGELLKDKIGRGSLSQDDILDIAIQLADGLAEAHENKIVHRDIKSSNIMITPKGQVKIMDFGLAKSAELTQITTEGTRLGTVAYMSPEQVRGEEADFRTDIWSLGVVLYEMITGERPFKGQKMQAIMYSILSNEPKPIQSYRSDIQPELIWIIKKAMTKKIDERYQSMKEMHADLKSLKTETATEVTKTLPKIDSFLKNRSRKRYLVIAVPILLALIALYLIIPFKSDIQIHRSIAVLPFVDLSPNADQEYFCDGITETIIGKISKLKKLKVISRTSVMRYKKTNKSLKDVGEELGVDTILEGSVQREENKIRVTAQLIDVEEDFHIWAETYNRDLESIFEVQDDLSQAIAEALKIKMTPNLINKIKQDQTTNVEAYEYYLKGIFYINSKYINNRNENDFETGLKMFEKAIDLDENYALAYYGLAWAYEARYVFTREKRHQDLVIENCKKAFKYDPDLPEANAAMGWVYFQREDFDNAYKSFKKAIEMNRSNSEIYHMSAVFLQGLGLFDRSVKYNTLALELDPMYIYTHINRAWDYISLGQIEKAEKDYKMARNIAPENSGILRGSAYLATLRSKFDEAEKFVNKAESINPDKTIIYKAILHAAKGNKEAALKLAKDERIYALLGMQEEAIDYIEKVISTGKYYVFQYSYLPLLNSPIYKPLQDHPRFKEILAKQKKIYDERIKKYGDL
jgi:serine/threonine protein kinase/Tfp pilus assembly protein PilF